MNRGNQRGRSPMQEGLDRNQAEGCINGFCGLSQNDQLSEMPREQGEEILFADRPRKPLKFVVDLQDAFKA